MIGAIDVVVAIDQEECHVAPVSRVWKAVQRTGVQEDRRTGVQEFRSSGVRGIGV
jgi:hypothetical protein